jgi:hypothetical protein
VQINIQNLLSTPLSLELIFEGGPGPGARIVRSRLNSGASVDVGSIATLDEVNNNSTVQSLRAAGRIRVDLVEQATDILSPSSQFNKLRNDVVAAFVSAVSGGATEAATPYHKANPASITPASSPTATDLPTVLVRANELRQKLISHLASTGDVGAHRAASAATVTAAVATDQATANTLLNQEKARLNTHMGEADIHIINDSLNTIAAADATDLASSITLANELFTDWNLHIAAAKTLDSLALGTS